MDILGLANTAPVRRSENQQTPGLFLHHRHCEIQSLRSIRRCIRSTGVAELSTEGQRWVLITRLKLSMT